MNNRNIERLIEAVEEFEPIWDGLEQRWTFFFREGRRWIRLRIMKYDGTYYFSGSDFDSFSYPAQGNIESDIEGRLPVWTKDIAFWKKAVAYDPIEAQSLLFKKLPLRHRRGVIQRKNVRLLIPKWMPIASQLSGSEKKVILEILRKAHPEPLHSMSLKRFLEYCREAYQANPPTFQEVNYQSGRGRAYRERSITKGMPTDGMEGCWIFPPTHQRHLNDGMNQNRGAAATHGRFTAGAIALTSTCMSQGRPSNKKAGRCTCAPSPALASSRPAGLRLL